MSTVTRLHPEEDNRQATDNNDQNSLGNFSGLGYQNRLLVALLLAGTEGIDAVDVTGQDNPLFWCDRLTIAIGRLKRRKFHIDGYLRKLTLPDGYCTRRKTYYLGNRQEALRVIQYLNDLNAARNAPPVFNADQKAAILKRFKRKA